MFVIELIYKAPLAEIDVHMPAHVRFLQKHYASGHFVVSGRKIPRDGGIILAVGERAQTLARLFNLREGLSAQDDRLPKRVMKAFASGPLAGVAIDEAALAWARGRYYELMRWDPQTGVPSSEAVTALGLDQLLGQALPSSA